VPLICGLFWAEDRTALKEWDGFADQPTTSQEPNYRAACFCIATALQARLVAATANARPGKTVLVVVGSQP
jgi:hypothetical protein